MRLCLIVLLLVVSHRQFRASSYAFSARATTWNFSNRSNETLVDDSESSFQDHQKGRSCFFGSCHHHRVKQAQPVLTSEEEETGNPKRLRNMFEQPMETVPPTVLPFFPKSITQESTTIEDKRQAHATKEIDRVNVTQSRVLPFSVEATQHGTNQYPTIQLAQIVRKLIFPDWLWQGSGLKRKVGLPSTRGGGGNETKSTGGSGVPISLFKFPTISFDSNRYSRFFQLFTMVKFNNTPCSGPTGLAGICYHSTECASFGGSGTSPCAGGLGVCCSFSYTCGSVSRQNGSYFVDGGMFTTLTGIGTCSLEIEKLSPLVKQIRLDFEIFSLQQPNAGNCELDRFLVSGQNINNVIPILCGDNNGTHIYVETWGSEGSVQLSVMTRGPGFRAWRIKITQYEMTSVTAPPYCLQQETGDMGTLNSFNYNSPTTPQYLNNLNYAICIQKAPGYCSITYTNGGLNGTYRPFQIVNANENGDLVIPSGQAGIGVRDCPYDYILINGNRLCGDKLNDGISNSFFTVDVHVTDFSNGPFIIAVRTNELDVSGGFFLNYRQNPCLRQGILEP